MRNILTALIDEKISQGWGEKPALRHESGNRWTDILWKELKQQRDFAAAAMLNYGIAPGSKTAVFAANSPEIIITDFAAYALRAIPVSIYSTSTADQVCYIVNDAGAEILFVGSQAQYAAANSIRAKAPTLKLIVVFEEGFKPAEGDTTSLSFKDFLHSGENSLGQRAAEIARISSEAVPEDIATFIYTSGTTGEPKGAVLTHANFNAALEIHDRRLTMLSSNDTSLCFLPLSHIFEKVWTYYCLHLSITVSVNKDPREITNALREVRPSCMCAVPRFWEKAYALIQDKMAKQKGFTRWLVRKALAVGRKRNIRYVRTGAKVPFFLELFYKFFDARIFSGVRKVMGIENGNIFPTAGAPLSDSITEFFHSIGVNIVVGYGLSETTATVSCYPQVGWEIGSVGTPLPEINVRIGENNEIQVKAPTIMRGYYNKPEATAEAFTADGWFRTGDAGRIDEKGNLIITDRLKDLFKTSNGKYIAPQALETKLIQDPFIEQVAVIGDRRKYVTALIIPAFQALKEYAAKQKIQYSSIQELLQNSQILKMITEHIEKLQANLANFEKIKKFTLIPRELTIEDGELTNTLKIRRAVINKHFAKEIEAMYR